jgi:ubiquinone/menaquinone biosynthesis C-methylase UbiE
VKESRLAHWESFWQDKKDIDEVYSNADRILRNLLAVTDLRGKKILEIGAGTGRDSFPLVQHGAEVVQLDYSPQSLRILKNLALEQHVEVTILGGDAFSLPFRDETFDIVFHQGLLEHFRKPRAELLLQENVRVLKKGGFLLVDVPQRYHAYTLAKHVLMALDKWFAGWERSFSMTELRRIVQAQGLTTVHLYGEWMYPSFFYRALREAAKKVGVLLPLYPRLNSSLSSLRAKMRSSLRTTVFPRYTGISIGVVGRK